MQGHTLTDPCVVHTMSHSFGFDHTVLQGLGVCGHFLLDVRSQLVFFLEHFKLAVGAHVLEGKADAGFREDGTEEVSLVGEVQGLLGEKTVGLEGAWGGQEEGADQVLVHV